MNFRTRRQEEPEINLIPLIDVLLMTLIFLLVTTSFAREARIRLKLPEAGGETRLEQEAVRVVIDAQGHFHLGGAALADPAPDQLRRALKQAVGGREDPLIVIQADRKTPHEAVVRTLDGARRLGYARVTFAAQQSAEEP